MLHAFVTDIHANLEALEAVLADIGRRKVDALYCLGDFVGYGASPNECIDRLLPLIEGAVAGNHDLAAWGGSSSGTSIPTPPPPTREDEGLGDGGRRA